MRLGFLNLKLHLLVLLCLVLTSTGRAQTFDDAPAHLALAEPANETTAHLTSLDDASTEVNAEGAALLAEGGGDEHHQAPAWTVTPFILLLLMIATGPLFYEHFWHKNYPLIAIALGLLVVLYYFFVIHNVHSPVHAMFEYVQFISLLAALYIASGGILISVDKEVTPTANVILLLVGTVIANIIGTTGASMLLIRPFIRMNRFRIKPYHIVFFIFMVSNVGGSLTPIGDPPLFLGFLKGVPFFWTLENNVIPWALASILLAILFFVFDSRNKSNYNLEEEPPTYSNKITLTGTKNFFWLLIVILSVLIDTKHKEIALRSLNENLFKEQLESLA